MEAIRMLFSINKKSIKNMQNFYLYMMIMNKKKNLTHKEKNTVFLFLKGSSCAFIILIRSKKY